MVAARYVSASDAGSLAGEFCERRQQLTGASTSRLLARASRCALATSGKVDAICRRHTPRAADPKAAGREVSRANGNAHYGGPTSSLGLVYAVRHRVIWNVLARMGGGLMALPNCHSRVFGNAQLEGVIPEQSVGLEIGSVTAGIDQALMAKPRGGKVSCFQERSGAPDNAEGERVGAAAGRSPRVIRNAFDRRWFRVVRTTLRQGRAGGVSVRGTDSLFG